MYFKKLVLLISILGLIVSGFISYQIYGTIFHPNTNFEQDHIMIRIAEDSSPEDIYNTITPFLEDPESFRLMAQKRALNKYVKSGLFRIEKGMSNNEIIDILTQKDE
ncbi:hypothetical protein ACJD0Z_08635 [Flavobacteriaceae bacterium M23B6Z8]